MIHSSMRYAPDNILKRSCIRSCICLKQKHNSVVMSAAETNEASLLNSSTEYRSRRTCRHMSARRVVDHKISYSLHLLLTDGDVWDDVGESFPIFDRLLQIVSNGDRHRSNDVLKPLIGLAYQRNMLVRAIFAMIANVGASILSYR